MRLRYIKGVATVKTEMLLCTGCGRCVDVCPRSVFMLNRKKAYIVDRDRCMECGACAKNCEPGAVTVESGVGCAQMILSKKLKKQGYWL